MSTPTNGKSPTGPLRTTAGASRPLTNGATRTTAGAGKTSNVSGSGTKKPVSTPLAARTSSTNAARSVRDTTAPRAGGKNASRRQQESRQEQVRKLAPLFAVIGIVLAAVIIFVVISNNSSAPASQATKTKVITALTTISPTIYDKVKTGGINNPLQKIPNGPAYVNSKGLPVVLYAGGQFCPYCAAERWSLVTAFSRFGKFTGLDLITSSESSISTLDFSKSTYTSQYVDFQPVEILDQNSNSLGKLTDVQQKVFDTYDGPPYSQSKGGIPFISYGNQFVTISSGFSPTDITGLSWSDISGALSDPTNAVTLKIIGNANYLTAAVCTLTKDNPGSVCKTQTIQDIEKTIKG